MCMSLPAMKVARDGRIYMLTGELDRICKLHSYDLSGQLNNALYSAGQ